MWSIFIVCVKWMGLTLNKYVNTILVAWYQSIQKKKQTQNKKLLCYGRWVICFLGALWKPQTGQEVIWHHMHKSWNSFRNVFNLTLWVWYGMEGQKVSRNGEGSEPIYSPAGVLGTCPNSRRVFMPTFSPHFPSLPWHDPARGNLENVQKCKSKPL